MKILHINSSDLGGGAEQFAKDMVDRQATSQLFVNKKQTSVRKVHAIKRTWLSYGLQFIDDALYNLIQRKQLTNLGVLYPLHGTYSFLQKQPCYHEADIIHLHNIHQDYFDLDALVSISKEKPIVWTLHDMWCFTGGEVYTFENDDFKQGNAITPYKKYYPLYNPVIDLRKAFLNKKREIYSALNGQVVFVPVSHWLGNCLKEAYVSRPEMQVEVIHNGVDTSVFKNHNHRNWCVPKVLFFNNTSNPFKGTALFRKIVDQINGQFELMVVGPPLDCQRHYELISPTYDRGALNRLYNQVDILVFPSEAENFPLTVLEAMAAGVMLVASDTGGIPEQVSNECGRLFISGKAESLKGTLEEVLKWPLSRIREMGKHAEEKVLQEFTETIMHNRYRKLYQQLIKKA
ncbi:glycosyltransferase [Rapidithrix thailandica]|uniref:Glycosyltransferase n=1 Tax=Rapidithrix thailandica TaxID=413964 RepID=A0AAW9S657_9BACT